MIVAAQPLGLTHWNPSCLSSKKVKLLRNSSVKSTSATTTFTVPKRLFAHLWNSMKFCWAVIRSLNHVQHADFRLSLVEEKDLTKEKCISLVKSVDEGFYLVTLSVMPSILSLPHPHLDPPFWVLITYHVFGAPPKNDLR